MKYAYTNGYILTGEKDMTPIAGQVILTDGELITDIVPEGADLTGYEVIDLNKGYIMPGLINLHVHLPASGKPKKKPTDNKKLVHLITSTALTRKILMKMCAGYAKTELFSGVTTLRAVGGVLDSDAKTRDFIAEGKLVGPRILAANMAVSVPGGHMAGSLAYEAHSPEEAKNFVRKIAEGKPDLIKLMITGGVLDATVKGEPGELKMAPELVKAACDEAHSLGLKVAAHVESPEGIRVALKNGVDSIEHGAKTDDEIISLFKEKNACLVATLSPALPYALFDREISYASELSQFNGNVVFEGIIDCAKNCMAHDIPVGLGTDTGCPFITHDGMWREVQLFHKYCGVSNAYALYSATKGNADIVGLGDVTGTIAKGKCADMIVSKGNPLDDLCTLRDLSMVVTRGRVYKNPKLKKSELVEREMDKFM
ncbi:MAG: amidohydrolase family protein [Lachnospiraceae bacterium]|nr:amidohydrolase family protein [Candidatus Minthocola equi]